MVIYSSAPRASIDGAWESRFDTVRSRTASLNPEFAILPVFSPVNPFHSSIYSNGQAYRWSIIPFSISPTRGHEVFGCRFDIHGLSKLIVIHLPGYSRKNVSTVEQSLKNNLSKRTWTNEFDGEYYSREKLSNGVFLFIGWWLDRDREIFRSSSDIGGGRGIGILARWGKVQRHARGNWALPWPDRGRLRLVAFPGKPDSISFARFTWTYWFLHWFDSLLLFTSLIITVHVFLSRLLIIFTDESFFERSMIELFLQG